MLQVPAITDIRDLGVFIAGIGAAVAGITWAVKTFRNGKSVNGGALEAEKRTNLAVDKVLERIDRNHQEVMELLRRKR